MNNSYEMIGHLSVTFPEDGCTAGAVCTMENYGVVHDCGAGVPFLGVVETANGVQAAVQVAGFAKVAYSGSHPEPGYLKLVADGNGGVMMNETGNSYWVISVNRIDQTMVIKL